ncbi:MAG: tRNA (guanosine(37)-N1)-methyltransferase TrmD [Gammaproteobacteria bacterium]|nr:tRNA (guanosine(37)-N1)-methyltransferase TrmD [Gammaproteobacteria bacterium]
MRFDVITLFPELVQSVAECGVVGRGRDQQRLSLTCWNPRDYSHNRHRRVDDRPYGGGPGMVMQLPPLRDCLEAIKQKVPESRVIYLSPQGRSLDQAGVSELAQTSGLIFIAGRYEGVDERFIQRYVDEEWSLGDYVLSGGELAAMVMIDAISRFIPGVLGDAESAQQDSFMDGLLDFPHYTRPEQVDGDTVPKVLCSGDHAAIQQWRRAQSLGRTKLRRPELLDGLELSEKDRLLLQRFHAEQN